MAERESTFTQHARRVLEQGKPQEALQVLQSWLPLNPDDAGAWEVAREAHLELDELDEAEHAAREVVRLRPESAEALCDLGVVLAKQGEADEARKALHQALSIDPSFERAQTLLEKLKGTATEPPSERKNQATKPSRKKSSRAPTKPPPKKKHQPPPPPPADEKPPPEPPAEEPPARLPAQKERSKQPASQTGVGWYGKPPDEPTTEGWKVRSPEGKVYGPYTESQLAEYLAQGNIHQDWGARLGSGRVTTVREALGPDRCNELLLQSREQQVQQQVSQQPAQQTEVASTIRCPHCGQWTVTAEKKSASSARLAIVLLGLLLWPVWLLLLVVKDKMQYRCASCGMQWTSEV